MSELREAAQRTVDAFDAYLFSRTLKGSLTSGSSRWDTLIATADALRTLLAGTPAEVTGSNDEVAFAMITDADLDAAKVRFARYGSKEETLRVLAGTPASREPSFPLPTTEELAREDAMTEAGIFPVAAPESLVASEGSEPLTDMDTVTIHRGGEPEERERDELEAEQTERYRLGMLLVEGGLYSGDGFTIGEMAEWLISRGVRLGTPVQEKP